MLFTMKKLTLCFLALLFSGAGLLAEKVVYKLDPVHSGVNFKIRHFVNRMPGSFTEFTGEIHFDKANPANSKAVATINPASVDTRNEDRDDHLNQDDYFNVAAFAEMTFTSTSWEVVDENEFKVTGDLTMLGKTNAVTLDVTFLGEVEGRGAVRSGWEATGQLDRREWGLTAGQPAIGNEVDIELLLQAHKQ